MILLKFTVFDWLMLSTVLKLTNWWTRFILQKQPWFRFMICNIFFHFIIDLFSMCVCIYDNDILSRHFNKHSTIIKSHCVQSFESLYEVLFRLILSQAAAYSQISNICTYIIYCEEWNNCIKYVRHLDRIKIF